MEGINIHEVLKDTLGGHGYDLYSWSVCLHAKIQCSTALHVHQTTVGCNPGDFSNTRPEQLQITGS